MSDTTYKIGNRVRCECTFRNSAGTLLDPTTVVLIVRKPGTTGAPLLYTPVRESLGVYAYEVLATAAGKWAYRFVASGNIETADEDTFVVDQPLADFADPIADDPSNAGSEAQRLFALAEPLGAAAAAVAGLMLSALDFEMTAITYDVTFTDVIASATVKWADGGAGVFTSTTINTTWHKVDAFTVTHADLGNTVTQAAVTRNAFGAVTAKPALTIT